MPCCLRHFSLWLSSTVVSGDGEAEHREREQKEQMAHFTVTREQRRGGRTKENGEKRNGARPTYERARDKIPPLKLCPRKEPGIRYAL